MNFGNQGLLAVVFVIVAWTLPFVIMVWFIYTLSRMAGSLRDIADRLVSLERAVRDSSTRHVT